MDERETQIETISRMYDAGESLVAIVRAVGTDDATIKLVAYQLGLSTRPGSKLDYARLDVIAGVQ